MNSPDKYDDALETLRRRYADVPAHEPDVLVDAAIHAAARQRAARRRLRAWTAVAGVAACAALAVVLVPALMVDTPVATDAADNAFAARQSSEPAPIDDSEAAKPSADEPAAVLERVQVTGSRITREEIERADAAFLAEQRRALVNANETAWRERILALRAEGDTTIAAGLLADFRERFGRDDSFTLEDLARENADE